MKRILVLYDSGYGATAEAAEALGRGLRDAGTEAEVRHIASARGHLECDALIIGSPIRIGKCTPAIKNWLKRNRDAQARIPMAFFFTCMSAIRTEPGPDLPVYIDPALDELPRAERRMSLMEKGHTTGYYVEHFLRYLPGIRPVAVAFFKGNLHLDRLSWRHRMIMRLAMYLMPEIRPGDYLNGDEVEAWAGGLASSLFG
jgi:menaquinone-dependent protoporphyrinogen oxidase